MELELEEGGGGGRGGGAELWWDEHKWAFFVFFSIFDPGWEPQWDIKLFFIQVEPCRKKDWSL